jgi:hypothetical protein
MATNYSTMWKNLTGQEEPITSRYEKRGIFPSVFDIPIYLFTNFNAKNYQYMQLHMLRNLQERHITLNNLGENAYANGDGRNFGMSPMQPYYVEDNNYVETEPSKPKSNLNSIVQRLYYSNIEKNPNFYLNIYKKKRKLLEHIMLERTKNKIHYDTFTSQYKHII